MFLHYSHLQEPPVVFDWVRLIQERLVSEDDARRRSETELRGRVYPLLCSDKPVIGLYMPRTVVLKDGVPIAHYFLPRSGGQLRPLSGKDGLDPEKIYRKLLHLDDKADTGVAFSPVSRSGRGFPSRPQSVSSTARGSGTHRPKSTMMTTSAKATPASKTGQPSSGVEDDTDEDAMPLLSSCKVMWISLTQWASGRIVTDVKYLRADDFRHQLAFPRQGQHGIVVEFVPPSMQLLSSTHPAELPHQYILRVNWFREFTMVERVDPSRLDYDPGRNSSNGGVAPGSIGSSGAGFGSSFSGKHPGPGAAHGLYPEGGSRPLLIAPTEMQARRICSSVHSLCRQIVRHIEEAENAEGISLSHMSLYVTVDDEEHPWVLWFESVDKGLAKNWGGGSTAHAGPAASASAASSSSSAAAATAAGGSASSRGVSLSGNESIIVQLPGKVRTLFLPMGFDYSLSTWTKRSRTAAARQGRAAAATAAATAGTCRNGAVPADGGDRPAEENARAASPLQRTRSQQSLLHLHSHNEHAQAVAPSDTKQQADICPCCHRRVTEIFSVTSENIGIHYFANALPIDKILYHQHLAQLQEEDDKKRVQFEKFMVFRMLSEARQSVRREGNRSGRGDDEDGEDDLDDSGIDISSPLPPPLQQQQQQQQHSASWTVRGGKGDGSRSPYSGNAAANGKSPVSTRTSAAAATATSPSSRRGVPVTSSPGPTFGSDRDRSKAGDSASASAAGSGRSTAVLNSKKPFPLFFADFAASAPAPVSNESREVAGQSQAAVAVANANANANAATNGDEGSLERREGPAGSTLHAEPTAIAGPVHSDGARPIVALTLTIPPVGSSVGRAPRGGAGGKRRVRFAAELFSYADGSNNRQGGRPKSAGSLLSGRSTISSVETAGTVTTDTSRSSESDVPDAAPVGEDMLAANAAEHPPATEATADPSEPEPSDMMGDDVRKATSVTHEHAGDDSDDDPDDGIFSVELSDVGSEGSLSSRSGRRPRPRPRPSTDSRNRGRGASDGLQDDSHGLNEEIDGDGTRRQHGQHNCHEEDDEEDDDDVLDLDLGNDDDDDDDNDDGDDNESSQWTYRSGNMSARRGNHGGSSKPGLLAGNPSQIDEAAEVARDLHDRMLLSPGNALLMRLGRRDFLGDDDEDDGENGGDGDLETPPDSPLSLLGSGDWKMGGSSPSNFLDVRSSVNSSSSGSGFSPSKDRDKDQSAGRRTVSFDADAASRGAYSSEQAAGGSSGMVHGLKPKDASEKEKLLQELPLTTENLDRILARAPQLICDAIRVCEDCLLRINDGAMFRIRTSHPGLTNTEVGGKGRKDRSARSSRRRSVKEHSLTLLDANSESYHTLMSLGIAKQKVTKLSNQKWDELSNRLYLANNKWTAAAKKRDILSESGEGADRTPAGRAASPSGPLHGRRSKMGGGGLRPASAGPSLRRSREPVVEHTDEKDCAGTPADPCAVDGIGAAVGSQDDRPSSDDPVTGGGSSPSASGSGIFSTVEDRSRLMDIIRRNRLRKAAAAPAPF